MPLSLCICLTISTAFFSISASSERTSSFFVQQFKSVLARMWEIVPNLEKMHVIHSMCVCVCTCGTTWQWTGWQRWRRRRTRGRFRWAQGASTLWWQWSGEKQILTRLELKFFMQNACSCTLWFHCVKTQLLSFFCEYHASLLSPAGVLYHG